MDDFSVTVDQHEIAAMVFLPLSEEHEVLGSFPWLDWLKSEVKDPLLFVYHHRVTGRFVLCQWLYPPWETTKPVLQELEGFNCDPSWGMWPKDLMHHDVLRMRLLPAQDLADKRRRQALDHQYALKRDREEALDQRNAAVKRLRQNNMHEAAHQIDIGAVPFAKPTEERRQQWIETFKAWT